MVATELDELPFIPLQRAPRCPLMPPAEFARWRENGGLVLASWRGQPTWVVSRYDDIRAALVDPRLSADTIPDVLRTSSEDGNFPVIFPRIDDPEHNRLRRMMTRDFTFRRAEEMRPRIQGIVDGFLDDMIAGGTPADLVRSFALPVPSLVISLLLGVPYEDHEFFQRNSVIGLDSRSTDEQRNTAIGAIFGYVFDLVRRKQEQPGDDLLSRLVIDHVATGAISLETAAMNGVIMLQAGHETTASMIPLGTLALLQHPEQLARLRDTEDPAVVANVVEELMRYLSIVHSLVERVALEDFELAGQPIRAGDVVLMNRSSCLVTACSCRRATGIRRSRPAPRSSTSTGIPVGTWVLATACTSASDRISHGSSFRWRSRHWFAGCPDCDWQCTRTNWCSGTSRRSTASSSYPCRGDRTVSGASLT